MWFIVGGAAAAERRPNVLFILADDLGWADVAPNNPQTFYETPNIDRLAARGVRFTRGYAASPVCSPTRASILTGRYPHRIPLTDYIPGARAEKLIPAEFLHHLPLEQTTIAEVFQDAGYATFFAGKWHLGGPGYYPEDQGFQVNMGGWEAGAPGRGGMYFPPYANPKLTDGPPGEHLDDRLAQETMNFIREHRDRPFFALLSFYSVHTPLMAKSDLVNKYRAKRQRLAPVDETDRWGTEGPRDVRKVQDLPVYGAMVETMDAAVGRVLQTLDELGLSDNTIVVFTSDNGGLSTSEGFPTSNLPLRAGKGWLYEGGIRVPTIIHAPGISVAGGICNAPMVSTDFYPTLLELAGLRLSREVDGVSLVPWLKDPGVASQRTIYWHYPHYGNQGGTPAGAIIAGRYKLIEFFEDSRAEMYDLSADIGESRDLSMVELGQAAILRRMLNEWRTEGGAEMPRANPGYDSRAVAAWHARMNAHKSH